MDRLPLVPRWAETTEQALQRVHAEGEDLLEKASERLRKGGVKVSLDVKVEPDAATAIIESARAHHVDLIAMSTHGRSGLSQVVQGSVASAVVGSGVAPVLLIRPNGG
jgi:nucleotide-binding universal stress UspA family protein